MSQTKDAGGMRSASARESGRETAQTQPARSRAHQERGHDLRLSGVVCASVGRLHQPMQQFALREWVLHQQFASAMFVGPRLKVSCVGLSFVGGGLEAGGYPLQYEGSQIVTYWFVRHPFVHPSRAASADMLRRGDPENLSPRNRAIAGLYPAAGTVHQFTERPSGPARPRSVRSPFSFLSLAVLTSS